MNAALSAALMKLRTVHRAVTNRNELSRVASMPRAATTILNKNPECFEEGGGGGGWEAKLVTSATGSKEGLRSDRTLRILCATNLCK